MVIIRTCVRGKIFFNVRFFISTRGSRAVLSQVNLPAMNSLGIYFALFSLVAAFFSCVFALLTRDVKMLFVMVVFFFKIYCEDLESTYESRRAC